MTTDLKIAKVYVSIYGSSEVRERTLARLETEKAHIRTQLALRLNLRFTPALQFYHDDTMDRVENLENLIKKIHAGERQRDGNEH